MRDGSSARLRSGEAHRPGGRLRGRHRTRVVAAAAALALAGTLGACSDGMGDSASGREIGYEQPLPEAWVGPPDTSQEKYDDAPEQPFQDVVTSPLSTFASDVDTASYSNMRGPEHFVEGGNNRVVLATDGDFNVGPSSPAELTDLIEEHARTGVYVSVLGFGMGNLKDSTMEAIADHGNGGYAYVDTLEEARKVLVDEFDATTFVVAQDLKVQVELNGPEVVAGRVAPAGRAAQTA